MKRLLPKMSSSRLSGGRPSSAKCMSSSRLSGGRPSSAEETAVRYSAGMTLDCFVPDGDALRYRANAVSRGGSGTSKSRWFAEECAEDPLERYDKIER